MLDNAQVRLVQIAVRKAGLRTAAFDGRYRMLLGQYLQPDGSPVTSCKQLNNAQLDDLLAICESMGWRMPGKPEDFYREKINKKDDIASFGQQAAIKHLADDLGIIGEHLSRFIMHQTNNAADDRAMLSPVQAYKVIEGLKALVMKNTGIKFKNLTEISNHYKGAKDGSKTNQVGN
ncbi:MAG: hypothetical protein WC454_09415 [Phycisphaerae bacterium]|jgi:hypothetical protein